MEVKIIPKQENIPDFDTKAIQIKHIDYYDPPYSSYEADEITEEVISKILEEIPKGLNIYPKLPEKIITTPLTLLVVPEKPPEICRFLQ